MNKDSERGAGVKGNSIHKEKPHRQYKDDKFKGEVCTVMRQGKEGPRIKRDVGFQHREHENKGTQARVEMGGNKEEFNSLDAPPVNSLGGSGRETVEHVRKEGAEICGKGTGGGRESRES